MGFFYIIMIVVAIVAFTWSSRISKTIKQSEENRKQLAESFNFNVKDELNYQIIGIIESERKFICISGNKSYEIPFNKIIGYEIIKDGVSVSKNSIKGAIVGGIVGGGIGALIGSNITAKTKEETKTIDVILTINDFENPTIKLYFYDSENNTLKNIEKYYLPKIEKWESIFKIIIERNKSEL